MSSLGSALRCLLITALLGCQSAPSPPDRDPPPPPPRPPAPASAASGSAAAPAVAAEMASAVGPGASAPGELGGAWAGRYDAKKGTVTLPGKVKDKALAADDGKTAVGPGTVEIEILAGGEIRGKTTGALGAGTISGKVDGAVLRAVVRADDPLASAAMTGIFIGEKKGEALACELHVAGPDGTVIRESTVELTRKK